MDLITLSDWLKKFPEVSVATANDNKALLDLFKLTPMKGKKIALYYDRSPDYFAFLKCHSPFHFVLIVKEDQKIKATGTLIIRPGIIQGKRRWVGYLGDLRVSDPKKWGRFWRKFYKTLMTEAPFIKEFQGTIHWQTCLMDENRKAKKALISSSSLGYIHYSNYCMNNLIIKASLFSKSKFKVLNAEEKDLPEIIKFYKHQFIKRDFGYVFDDDFNELIFRLKTWPGLSQKSLLMIKQGDQILGATLLWKPSLVKKIKVEKLSTSLKFLGKIIRMTTPWPREKEELSCLYPTLFQVLDEIPPSEKEEVAFALLAEALRRRKEFSAHVVSFASFDHEDWKKVMKKFIHIKTNLELLTVDPLNQTKCDYLFYSSPGLEMALV